MLNNIWKWYEEAAQLELVEPKKNWQELALLIGGACIDTWIRDIVDDDYGNTGSGVFKRGVQN